MRSQRQVAPLSKYIPGQYRVDEFGGKGLSILFRR
jgi:hypothetical protein